MGTRTSVNEDGTAYLVHRLGFGMRPAFMPRAKHRCELLRHIAVFDGMQVAAKRLRDQMP
jgi:hypothetical protein